MKKLVTKRNLLILSVMITVITAMIPNLGMKVIGEYHHYGCPAEVLSYASNWRIGFSLWNFLFNIVFYYFTLRILMIIIKGFIPKSPH
ncbi:hypothetical protein [Heyndrickxia ginsengihumi]|uniref:Uncharacterized protein n=1 Tax=Heyndrickxia ginsengihumi TaxID=363870 RepID=A0A6M0PBM7_9BACI|nr:hypothetical protein [Heyndrickxia ginsengihumi]MBE6184258.1 hypothetical protein [Bacillus sp. (in: firmicutes)]NEY21499.1 hypothetical protein [Heyndrickxia ginsengihumi]